MPKDDMVYLGHMLDTAKEAQTLIQGKDRKAFDTDRALRLALAHLIQTLGEAARQVSEKIQKEHSEIPWEEVIGMRHKIVHDYMAIDEDIVWQVVTIDLPALIIGLEGIIGQDLEKN